MSALAEKRLTVDEFLRWRQGQQGKWELYDGVPVAMALEQLGNTETKGDAFTALRAAIKASGAPCRAYTEGVTVRIRANKAFVPDVSVICPPPPSRRDVSISNPLVVVEVLSPSTAGFDQVVKLEGYFSLPSLAHYLIIDPDDRFVIHHAREREGVIETRILHHGFLRLDPPGLEVAIADFFTSMEEATEAAG